VGFAEGVSELSDSDGEIRIKIGDGWNDTKEPIVITAKKLAKEVVAETPNKFTVYVNNSHSMLSRFGAGDFALIIGHEFKHAADWSACLTCMSNIPWREGRAHRWMIENYQNLDDVKKPIEFYKDAQKPYEALSR
jgi:hypothetical protein